MFTVGSLAAPKVPIVTTGPPPLMIVLPAPEPRIVTLTSTVIPPAYVPGATVMTSPLAAAATAGASCVYAHPCGQTVNVDAEAALAKMNTTPLAEISAVATT
jgi:hypothetical protein